MNLWVATQNIKIRFSTFKILPWWDIWPYVSKTQPLQGCESILSRPWKRWKETENIGLVRHSCNGRIDQTESFDMSHSTGKNATLKSKNSSMFTKIQSWLPSRCLNYGRMTSYAKMRFDKVDMLNAHLKPVDTRAITAGPKNLFWSPELTWLQWTSGSPTQRRAFAISTWFKPSNFKPLKNIRTHDFRCLALLTHGLYGQKTRLTLPRLWWSWRL